MIYEAIIRQLSPDGFLFCVVISAMNLYRTILGIYFFIYAKSLYRIVLSIICSKAHSA